VGKRFKINTGPTYTRSKKIRPEGLPKKPPAAFLIYYSMNKDKLKLDNPSKLINNFKFNF